MSTVRTIIRSSAIRDGVLFRVWLVHSLLLVSCCLVLHYILCPLEMFTILALLQWCGEAQGAPLSSYMFACWCVNAALMLSVCAATGGWVTGLAAACRPDLFEPCLAYCVLCRAFVSAPPCYRHFPPMKQFMLVNLSRAGTILLHGLLSILLICVEAFLLVAAIKHFTQWMGILSVKDSMLVLTGLLVIGCSKLDAVARYQPASACAAYQAGGPYYFKRMKRGKRALVASREENDREERSTGGIKGDAAKAPGKTGNE
jgi:hypothetical protein